MSQDSPKTPEHEKTNVAFSDKVTRVSSKVFDKNSKAASGDQRYDSSSMGTAVQAARGAGNSAAKLKAMRRQGGTAAAQSSMSNGVEGFAQSGIGGRTVDARHASRNISGIAQLGSTLSSYGQSESLRKFTESNQKKQFALDAITAAGLHMAYKSGGDKGKPIKPNDVSDVSVVPRNPDRYYTAADDFRIDNTDY